ASWSFSDRLLLSGEERGRRSLEPPFTDRSNSIVIILLLNSSKIPIKNRITDHHHPRPIFSTRPRSPSPENIIS
ncbi:hypothetical protein LINGRAPRIM_LOCUS120, partial [Linum grandiflorum]